MKPDGLCYRDVAVEIFGTGIYQLILHGKGSEGELFVPSRHMVRAVDDRHALVGTEIDFLSCCKSGIPIEGGRGKTVGGIEVGERLIGRTEHRKTVVGRYPEVAGSVAGDALDTVVHQSVLCGKGLELPVARVVACGAVDAVVVAANPYDAVGSLAEARYLVNHLRVRLVELVHIVGADERIFPLWVTIVEIDDSKSGLAAHP